MAVALEQAHRLLGPTARAPAVRARLQVEPRAEDSYGVSAPRSIALTAVVVLHAFAIAGLLAVSTPSRPSDVETVTVTTLLPAPPDARAPEATPEPPRWTPRLDDVPMPLVDLTRAPESITLAALPEPRAVRAAPVIEASAALPPTLDAQSVGYVVAPVPRYPEPSRRLREQGEVLLRVLIDTSGRPSEVEVLRSSGFPRLDLAALESLKDALFRPYVVDGRPRAAYVRVPIDFSLRRS